MTHKLQLRVYYEDTDAGGIVYYANYLKFAERGRTEWLRSHGFENQTMRDEHGVLFVVRHIEADYKAPARLDDLLEVQTELAAIKNASFSMKQVIFSSKIPLFTMNVVLACINEAGKPAKLPAQLKADLKKQI